MTISEIKAALEAGQIVHWANAGYRVVRDQLGQYLVVFERNGHAIGLTDRAGTRLNGSPEDFFVG